MTNLMATTDKQKAHTTMFEVSDNGREHERYGHSYFKPFIGFIESLGFEIAPAYEHATDKVKINGYEFAIDVASASYKSYNPYGRREQVREPRNRYVALKHTGYEGTTIFNIRFNKEYKVETLKAKINNAIEHEKKRIADNEDYLATYARNTCAIGEHFLENSFLKLHTDYVTTHKGEVRFCLSNGGYVFFNLQPFTFLKAQLGLPELNTVDLVYDLPKQADTRARQLRSIVRTIQALGTVAPYLREWAADAHEARFYVATWSTEWKAKD